MIQMKNKWLYLILLFFAVFSCSDKIAGGSGAGNPGATTVAVIAVTTDSSEIPDTIPDAHSGIRMYPDTVKIIDDSSGKFVLIHAELKIRRIVFLFDSLEKRMPDLDSIQLPLTASDYGIILDGPFVFNILSGNSFPPVPRFSLPEGKYKGIRVEYDTIHPVMTLNCSFEWNGRTHHMTVSDFFTGNDMFKKENTSFNINRKRVTTLRILLNASKWFRGIAIGPKLDNGELTIGSDSTLYMKSSGSTVQSALLAGKIADNLRKSGKLLVNHSDTQKNED
jgi:hypothetical protein